MRNVDSIIAHRMYAHLCAHEIVFTLHMIVCACEKNLHEKRVFMEVRATDKCALMKTCIGGSLCS